MLKGSDGVFVFVSILLIVLRAGLAVAYVVTPRTRTWSIIRICVSGALTVAGTVTAIADKLRFSSLEAHNEWARDAFAQFSTPLEFSVALAVIILAGSVLTAKRRTKTVICLAVAPVFSLLIFGYTALFSIMTNAGALSVDRFICVYGCALEGCFAAVALAAEGKRLYLDRKAQKSARKSNAGRKKAPCPDDPDAGGESASPRSVESGE